LTVKAGALVLWDIDRTLLYVGDVDQQIYRDVFFELLGRAPSILPERGTGITTPIVLRRLFADGGVPDQEISALTRRAMSLLPLRLAGHRDEFSHDRVVMPGALAALEAVGARAWLVQTVVSGNLRANALIKLAAAGLDGCLDLDVAAFASDDDDRPSLVGIAQRRAGRRYGVTFDRANTVIIGDSREDVRTGLLGGSAVIGVASGTTTRSQLEDAGADIVLDDLSDAAAILAAVDTLTSSR